MAHTISATAGAAISNPAPRDAHARGSHELWWRWGIPLAGSGILSLLPAPAGLAADARGFLSLFAGIVAALVLEPLPPAAVGVLAITLGAFLSHWTLFGPKELADPKFK